MRALKRFEASDPLADVDVDTLVDDSLFDELRRGILAEDAVEPPLPLELGRLGPLPERSRRLHRALVAVVVIVVAGTLSGVLGSGGSNGTTTTLFAAARSLGPGPGARASGASSSWQLVSQVTNTGWQQNASSGPPPGQLTCPSTAACYALSGKFATAGMKTSFISESLYVSNDFGLKWSVLPMPSGFLPTTRLSCATDSDCAVAGVKTGRTVFIRTTDGGHQWTIARWKGAAGLFSGLSCPTATSCLGIFERLRSETAQNVLKFPRLPLLNVTSKGETLVITTDGGISWASQSLPAHETAGTVTCTSASSCLVLGMRTGTANASLIEKLDQAATSLRHTIISALQIGNESIGLPQYPLPPRFQAPVAALPAAITRYELEIRNLHVPAAQQGVVAVIVADANALKHDIALNAIDKLPAVQWNNHGSQLGTAQRTLDDELILQPFDRQTTNGGATWTQRPLPVTNIGASPLSCSNNRICATVGSPSTAPDLLVTTDGGASWKVRGVTIDLPNASISNVTCPTAAVCWATGHDEVPTVIGNAHYSDSALMAGTTNGGRTWTLVPLRIPAKAPNYEGQSYEDIGAITCPRVNACLALGVVAEGSPTTPIYRLLAPR